MFQSIYLTSKPIKVASLKTSVHHHRMRISDIEIALLIRSSSHDKGGDFNLSSAELISGRKIFSTELI